MAEREGNPGAGPWRRALGRLRAGARPGADGGSGAAARGDGSGAQLLADLVAANRILAEQGIVDGYGHVSVRCAHDPSRFLLSRALAPELVTAGDVLEHDLDGAALEPQGRPLYSERFLHAEIYRARPDVHSVVHDHSPGAVLFGVLDAPLRALHHMSAFLGKGLPVWDARHDAAGALLVSDPAAGRSLAETLADRPAELLRGHGAVIVGRSLPEAVGRAVYLERGAQLQAQAMATGQPITWLDETETDFDPGAYSRAWKAWKRGVRRG